MSRALTLDAQRVVAARNAALAGDRDRELTLPDPVLVDRTGSTNDDLAAAVGAPHLGVLATLDQRGGHGRLDRVWEAPPGACLATSFQLTVPPTVPVDALGWATVVLALVSARTVNELAGRNAAALKWPNDLLVDGSKAAGILARLVPGGGGEPHRVIAGIGINLNQSRDELPVGTATSLSLAGIDAPADELLGRLWAGLARVVTEWFNAGGSVTVPLSALGGVSVLDAARAASSTLGNDVRVHLPGGRELVGVAVDLDADGCVVVEDSSGERHHIHAGDVVHLRRSDGGYA